VVLQNFILERVVKKISLSEYKNWIILNGGMLIASMVGISSRTTMDMDATLRGVPLTEETIRVEFQDICVISVDDEVNLTLDHVAPTRADDEYGGFRIALIARFELVNTSLKIDITNSVFERFCSFNIYST
jgi:hypothetical protein